MSARGVGACSLDRGCRQSPRIGTQARLDVGAVIRRVFDIYVEQAPVLMPAAAVVFVFTGIVSARCSSLASPGLALVALLIDLVAVTLFTGMVVELVADVQDGRRDATAGSCCAPPRRCSGS